MIKPSNSTLVASLVPGRRYKVVIAGEAFGARRRRVMIATFLDTQGVDLSFSGRPRFGTATIDMRHLISADLTIQSCHEPRIQRNPA